MPGGRTECAGLCGDVKRVRLGGGQAGVGKS